MYEPNMIAIPEGEYTLGVPEPGEDIQHKWNGPRKVKINRFMLAETSVTVREYKKYLEERCDEIPPDFKHIHTQDNGLPAGGLSWLDALGYSQWVRKETGKPYRLPTSDEWEIAARGGLTGKKFSWGDESPAGKCDFGRSERDLPLPVKSFAANGYGLYDMAGSVWNWCSDLWIQYSLDEPPVNSPTRLDPRMNVILRGGSFMTPNPGYLMCACVHEDPPDLRHPCLGMRLASDLNSPE